MLKAKYLNMEELVLLHNNPRIIRDNDFLRLCDSVKNNPLFFEARPIIASDRTGELVVIAGNQRLRAAKQVGMEQVPVVVIPGLTEAQEAEIIFRDNISNGEFDWDIVANEFSDFDLEDWGLIGWETKVGGNINPDELSDSFSLKDGDRDPFQQITFMLSDVQAEFIRAAIENVKAVEGFDSIETFGNSNTNGNAIYAIVKLWDELRK